MPIRHAEWRVRSNQVIKFSSYTRRSGMRAFLRAKWPRAGWLATRVWLLSNTFSESLLSGSCSKELELPFRKLGLVAGTWTANKRWIGGAGL